MKFSSLFAFAPLVTLASALPLPVDAGSVELAQRDISDQCYNLISWRVGNITSKVSALSTELTTIKQNDIVGLLDINFKAQDIAVYVAGTASIIQHCGNWSDTQFFALAPGLLGLSSPVEQTLTQISNLKPTLDRAILGFISVSGLVKFDVQWLQKEVKTLGTALEGAVSASIQPIIANVIGQLLDAFAATLEVYKNVSPITL